MSNRSWAVVERAVPVALGVAAAAVLLPRLDTPDRIFFDETYYVNDARQYLDLGVEATFAVHPPVGKWLIAAGIQLVGDDPAGWRLPGALLAVASVVLVYSIGLRLFGSVLVAAGAAALLLVDGMFISQARIAMLDVHLLFFVVLGVDLLLRDRAARMAGDGHDPPPWWRRGWLLGAGVAFGLAIATKWSGLFALGAAGLVFLAQEALCRRAARSATARTGHAHARHEHALDSRRADDVHVPPGPAADGDADVDVDAELAAPPAPRVSVATRVDTAGRTAPDTVDAPDGRQRSSVHDATEPHAGAAASTHGIRSGTASGHPSDAAPPGHPAQPPVRAPWPGVLLRTAGAALGALVLVPTVVYVLTWLPWLANYVDTTEFPKDCPTAVDTEPPRLLAEHPDCTAGLGERLVALAGHHRAIWVFHTTLESEHSYLAPATTWPVLGRPVVYYYQDCSADRAAGVASTDDDGTVTEAEPCEVAEGDAAEVLALGNPAVWWGFLLALPLLLARAGRGDARAAVPLVLWAGQFVPWLLSPRPSFFFYTAPLVPFIALGLAGAVALLHERHRGTARARTETTWSLAVGFAAGSVGFLVGLLGRDEEVGTAVGILFAVLGVLVAGQLEPGTRREGRPAWWHNPAALVAAGVALLAFGLFVYFLPVWTALPMAKDAIRERWWFSSWI